MPCLQQRKTLRRLTSWTRCQDSRLVSRTEPSSVGLMPALFISTSMWPNCSRASASAAGTCCSSATSAAIVRVPTACAPSRSMPTTFAPSAANSRADSAPIPLAVPVTTQTFPSSLPAIGSAPSGRVVDVLDVGVVLERVGPELPPDPGLLEASEWGRHTDGSVGVDRDGAGLQRPRDPQRLGAVSRPDRTGEAVDGVVGEAQRLLLVAEGDDAGNRTEDLLGGGAILV